MFGPKPIRPLRHYILPALFVGSLFVVLIMRREPLSIENVYQGEVMGTYWIVKIHSHANLEKNTLQKVIQAELDDINSKMSTYLPDSEISRFNEHASMDVFPISNKTHAVMKAAQQISKQSQGAFDISIKPLINLWGFGSKPAEEPPTEADIALAMGSIGYQKILLLEKGIRKDSINLQIDVSAIAKGYAVDQVAEKLHSLGHEKYMVDVGGEIRAKGINTKNRAWRIGIETPDAERGSYTDIIELKDISIATSGDYRNFYEQDGKRISHTIDARTGNPITHRLASVSVLHPSAMMADGWATALNVLGPTEAMKLAQKKNLPIMLIIRKENGEHNIQYSSHFEQYRVKMNSSME